MSTLNVDKAVSELNIPREEAIRIAQAFQATNRK
jgi:hypothetical protein